LPERLSRRWLCLALALAAALAAAAGAAADGDPASDYLLGQAAFVPPDAGIADADAARLASMLAEAKKKGFEVRVALIATRADLGAVTALYRKPKEYARFLGQELYFVYKGRLVVVMPNGYGFSRGGRAQPAGQALLDRLPGPEPGGTGLVAGALQSVRVLARAAGVRVAVPKAGAGGGNGSVRDRVVIAAAAAAGAVVLGGVALVRRRRRGGAR
jgi:hypothetical protein